jgi:hypothetical protein
MPYIIVRGEGAKGAGRRDGRDAVPFRGQLSQGRKGRGGMCHPLPTRSLRARRGQRDKRPHKLSPSPLLATHPLPSTK